MMRYTFPIHQYTLLLLVFAVFPNPLCVAQRPRGTVVTTSLTSPSLEGNTLGDPATRQARVYLPPSYNSTTKRYPVLYYLHGAFGDEHRFFNHSGSAVANRLIGDGDMSEMIVVGVDASGGQPITSYVNSELNGNYRDYIVEDLVQHIDAEFRTISDRNGRGVFGASMGGFGAYFYAMTESNVFGAAYSTNSGFHSFSRPDGFPVLSGDQATFPGFPNMATDLSRIHAPSDIQPDIPGLIYAWASAFSPNLEKPPLRVDLPFELTSLRVIPEIRYKWYAYDAFILLDEHDEDLSSLRGFAFDVGDQDDRLLLNEAFHHALLEKEIEHQFKVFSGGHGDSRTRIGSAMRFLSQSLLSSDCDADGVVSVQDINCAQAEGSQPLADAILDELGSLLGDIDGDGSVQFSDFLVLSANFGLPGKYTDGDIDFSGTVDFPDFLALSTNFGKTSTAAMTPVPEPTDMAVTAILLMAILRYYGASDRSVSPSRHPLFRSCGH